MTNGCEVYEKEEHLDSISVKEEPPSEDDVQSDIPLECMLCAKKLHTVSGLKAHVIAQHNYKSVKRKCGHDSPSPKKRNSQSERYVCDTCQRIFTTSTDLKVHEVCHDKFCCFACNAKFNSFSEVTAHRRRCKVKNTFVKPKTLTDILRERVQQKRNGGQTDEDHKKALRVHCLKCNDSFKDIYEYKLHKLAHHRDEHFVESLNTGKIEIEIENIALDNAEQKRNDKEADLKEYNKIDYNKIETELESIFEIDVEKRKVKITSLEENETNDSVKMLDKKDHVQKKDQEQTIEEILSQDTEPCNQIERQTFKTDPDKDESINDSNFFIELTGIDITASSECVTLKIKPKVDKETNDSSESTEAANENAETDWRINHDEVNNTLKTDENKLAKDSEKEEIELDVSELTSQAENNDGDVEIMQNTYRDTDKTSELKKDSDNEIELDISELTSQKNNNDSDNQVTQDTYIETDKQSEQAKDSHKNEMELDVSESNSRKENKQDEVLNKIVDETSILTETVNQNVLEFNVSKSNREESEQNLNKNSEIDESSKITEPVNEIDEDISAVNKLEENTVGNEKKIEKIKHENEMNRLCKD